MEKIEKLRRALDDPDAVDSGDCGSPNYFDPWEVFDSIYGSYASAFDQCAIQVLEDILSREKRREDLASEMFREILCVAGLCDYGSSPRFCFPNKDFKELLPELIRKWKAYYAAQWGEPYVQDDEDV